MARKGFSLYAKFTIPIMNELYILGGFIMLKKELLKLAAAIIAGVGTAAIALATYDAGKVAGLKAVLLFPNKNVESLVKVMTDDEVLAYNVPSKFDRFRIKMMGTTLKDEFDIKD